MSMTTKQYAAKHGVSVTTAKEHIRKGKITARKIKNNTQWEILEDADIVTENKTNNPVSRKKAGE